MLLLIIVFAGALISGYLSGLIFMFVGAALAAHGLYGSVGAPSLLLLGSLVLSLPLAAFTLGCWLDRYALDEVRSRTLRTLLLALCLSAAMQSGVWFDLLAAALALISSGSQFGVMAALLASFNAALLCAAIAAFALMLIALIVEIPVLWLSGSMRMRGVALIRPLRPLLIVILVSLAFNHIMGLFSVELRSTRILAELIN